MGSSIWELHDEWSVDKKIRAEQEEYLKKLLRKQTTAHDRMVENLQRQLVEESEQTAAERSELLEQVKELMDRDEQGQKARDERWLARLQVQQEFAQGLLAVLKKDPVDWVERSRDVSRDWERNVGTLKGIEKSMQTFASDRLQSFGALNRSLQGVQDQTLATIDQQVTQFTSQMQSMDEFVQKVQTETHRQETDRQQRLQAAQDQIAINQHLNRTLHSSARIRLAARVEVAKAHTAKLNEALAASEQEIVQPLAQLRTDVSAVPFVPYVATGATPARRAVRIPHQLPRTNRSPLQISSLEPEVEESASAKSLVYADEDPENQARKSSTIREEQVEDVVIDEGTYAGLREVDPNAHAPKQTIVPPRDFSMSLPLKRLLSSNEITGAGKPVKKKRATRATMAALACEGSENGGSVQAGFARSTGRRLRGREVL